MASAKHLLGHWLTRFRRAAVGKKRPQPMSTQPLGSVAENPGLVSNGLLGLPWPGLTSVWWHDKEQSQRPFYFVHIPKTAGTSLITTLDRLFHQRAIFPAQLWRELTPELAERAGEYAFFRGHFGGGGLKVFAGQQPRLLTLLRDPVSLSVSTYHFVKREKNTRVHALVQREAMSLLQFVTDSRTGHLIENRQVRYLSFDIHDDPDAQDIFLSERSEQVVRHWLPDEVPQLSAEQRYQRAQALLKRCDWFGLQERFDDSLRLFAWQFGLPPLGNSERLNVKHPAPGEADAGEDDATRDAMLARNHWDNRLYRWASEVFERRFSLMRQDLEAWRLNDADTLDDLLRRAYRRRAEEQLNSLPQDSLPAQFRYDFAWPLLGSHWHRRELALPEKQWFRWSGPAPAADLWLVLQPGDYVLNLDIANGLGPEDIENLQLAVNGVALPVQVAGDAHSVVRQLTAQVPARVFSASPLLRLQLTAPRSQPHARAFGSDDHRRVAVAVRSLGFEPVLSE